MIGDNDQFFTGFNSGNCLGNTVACVRQLLAGEFFASLPDEIRHILCDFLR